MPPEPGSVAARLYAGVMAPLVLGGAMRPGHALGARVALALAGLPEGAVALDSALSERVQRARLRRARALVPIDVLDGPAGPEWALGAGLHDLLQSVNPGFDTALRRRAAAKLLELADATLARVPLPESAREALARHTWFARVLEIARTDTLVSWWTGSRTFRGTEPPARLQAWPGLRRVSVHRSERSLVKLAPGTMHGERVGEVVARLLSCTPLTDLATCTRAAPAFRWTRATAGLVGSGAGQVLVLRALGRLPTDEVDAALGSATREALGRQPDLARAAFGLLGERALAEAAGHVATSHAGGGAAEPAAMFARALGAAIASRRLASEADRWPEAERRRLLQVLEPTAQEGRATLSIA